MIIFVLIPVIVVALGVAGFFLYKRHKRGNNLRHKRVGSIASVAPSQCATMQDPERGDVELRNTAFISGLGSSDLDIVGSPKGLGEDSKLGDNNAASAAPGLLEDSVNEATSIATEDGADVDHAALFTWRCRALCRHQRAGLRLRRLYSLKKRRVLTPQQVPRPCPQTRAAP